jgi:hypothetical protein
MAPEIMRYNGEEEYTEKVKLKFWISDKFGISFMSKIADPISLHYSVVQLPAIPSVRIVMCGQLNVTVFKSQQILRLPGTSDFHPSFQIYHL